MTYKSYIKKDYKMIEGKATAHQSFISRHHFPYLLVTVTLLAGVVFFSINHFKTPKSVIVSSVEVPPASASENLPKTIEHEVATFSENTDLTTSDVVANDEVSETTVETVNSEVPAQKFPLEKLAVEAIETLPVETLAEEAEEPYWESVKVKSGDNLALIFKRKRLSPRMLYNIMALGEDTSILKNLKPGQELRFLIENGEFEALQYDVDLTDTLYIKKLGDIYSADLLEKELEVKVKTASGTIKDSLFLTGKRSGLSDNMIMQLINLYGWDIDFAMEVRKGDQFNVLFEERYKDGVKVQDGPILAAEFVNRGKSFKAVRYTHADGRSDYYAENGNSMRKAFLRTPVEFARISSRFSLGRKHPILNKIRAHKGVDYAASTGTPIKAAGDGVVKLAARKGGYGKTVILQHGGKYTTLYGHLSRYARGVKRGAHVKQGQTIGYIGMTGLATGPHLHYEFRVNGVHRNPLTVKLPKAMRIPDTLMEEFKTQTEPLLAQLDTITNRATAAAEKSNSATLDRPVLALNEQEQTSPSPHN